MSILNDIVGGAARQFGREFGRAGANIILQGANSYTIKGVSDCSDRIKPSDSRVVKSIKEINKIKFATTNKANVSRLIEITNTVITNIQFDGNNTLFELNDFNELIKQYNDKFDHGSSLIDNEFKDESIDYLNERRNEFIGMIGQFNIDIKNHISQNLEISRAKKKSKKTAVILAIPLLGLQWAYLNSAGYTVLSVLLFWTILVPLINLLSLIKLLFMNENKFDHEFNPEYLFYQQFVIKN
jgi:hypothetical protein